MSDLMCRLFPAACFALKNINSAARHGVISGNNDYLCARIRFFLSDVKERLLILSCLLLLPLLAARAQLHIEIVDDMGYAVPFANATYRGHHISAASDIEGKLTIMRHEGWTLSISSVGFKEQTIKVNAKTPESLKIVLKEDTKTLNEVIVTDRKGKYSRKNNPAVELMRRVIAAKKKTDLSNKDYYQYLKYQKLTLALNDLTKERIDSGAIFRQQFVKDQVERCKYNDKLILPVITNETVTQKIYRREPKSEKSIILGENKGGVNQLIETGDIIDVIMKDVFTDVDIYDDQIRLLQYPFTSPIGKDAIDFYRYYIEDTVYVDKDLCYHMQFIPNNQQDFGFRGEMYILADSTLHVKKCSMTIPKRSDVNFVENLRIDQTYEKQSSGDWVLTQDDMIVELKLASWIQKLICIRATKNSDYSFEPIANKLFKGKAAERREASASMRSDDFWGQYRTVELTKSEAQMNSFIDNIKQIKGFGIAMTVLSAVIENFVETKHGDSKVDIGPINTIISKNFVDGFRTRMSAQTTANLNPHWFLAGYYARGWKSHQNYYEGVLTYSFNKKDYLPREFPKRTLTLTIDRDIALPSDKWIRTDKDNVFTSFKWATIDKMYFYEKQELKFEREEDWGFKTTIGIKREYNEGYGEMHFTPVADYLAPQLYPDHVNPELGIHTTEIHAEIRIAPGETYINTKQRRLPINLDAPVFTIGHTIGIKGFLGGDYNYNLTMLEIYKRFWVKSWGKIDIYLKSGWEWNKVPYPLLIMPRACLSYILEDETFNLINNMEFLNDKYVSMQLSWDLNGKIFNRIPLIRNLKWREFLGVNVLWGNLSDKNNPYLHPDDKVLFQFPKGCYIMDANKPYVEAIIGIHNIFKLLHVEYVRRLTYTELPTAKRNSVRFTFRTTF